MIKIFSDSSCDFSEDLVKKWDLCLVPFYILFDADNSYKDRVDLQPKPFYERLQKEKIFPKTSQPPIQDYLDYFRPALEEGCDIICLCMSSKLSGSYQSAFNARNILKEEYPERKIEVIDSLSITGSQALVLYQILKMRNDGKSFEFILEYIPMLIESAKIYFIVENLEYLQRGGRKGKVNTSADSLLNVKPLITVENGALVPVGQIRSRKKAIREIIDTVVKQTANSIDSYDFVTINSNCEDEAIEMEQILKDEFHIKTSLPPLQIGLTIGTHIGPKSIGVVFIKKYEML